MFKFQPQGCGDLVEVNEPVVDFKCLTDAALLVYQTQNVLHNEL